MSSRFSRRSIRWLLFTFFLYVVILGGSSLSQHRIGFKILYQVVMTGVLGGWLLAQLRRGKSLPSTALDIPIAVYFLVQVVATIFAIDPRVSVEALWNLLIQILLFYYLVFLMRRFGPRMVIEPLFAASAIVILLGVMEFSSWYAGIPPLPFIPYSWLDIGGLRQPIPPELYRLQFTLQVPTLLSSFFAVMIPVAVGWIVATKSSETRLGLGLWVVGALAIELFAFSRGGLLAVAVGLFVFSVLYVVGLPEARDNIRRAVADWRIRIAALVLIGIVVAGAWAWTQQQGRSGHQAGDVLRLDLWRSAWEIGLAHPITGVGPYGFGRQLRLTRNPLLANDSFVRPDNVVLLLWSEAGVLGVLALGYLGIVTARHLWYRWRQVEGQDRIRVSAVIAALSGFLVHNLVDTFVTSVAVMLIVAGWVAYTVYDHEPESAGNALYIRRWVSRGILALIVLSVIGWSISDLAQINFQRAVKAVSSGEYPEALTAIDKARHLDPSMGMYAAQRAQIMGMMALEESVSLDDAISAYEEAFAYENSSDALLANYGFLLAEVGRVDEAAEQLERAAAIQPREPYHALLLAGLYEALGRDTEAKQSYVKALELSREWVVSPYWRASPLRTEARAEYLRDQGLSGVELRDLAMMDDRCWRVFAGAAAPSKYCAAVIAQRDNQPSTEIETLLAAAIEADPTNGSAYAVAAEADLASGDLEAAETNAQAAIFFGETRGYYVLGLIAAERGDVEQALDFLGQGGPSLVQDQGWDVAVFGRRGGIFEPHFWAFDAPGPTRYSFASWLALVDLYQDLGRPEDALNVYNAIESLDPFFAASD